MIKTIDERIRDTAIAEDLADLWSVPLWRGDEFVERIQKMDEFDIIDEW